MMKGKGLLAVFVCILILSGCGGIKSIIGDRVADPSSPSTTEVPDNLQEESKPMSQPKLGKSETKSISRSNSNKKNAKSIPTFDLMTEENIRDYLVGEWTFDKEYVSDVVCKMDIDEDLNVHLSFHDLYIDEAKGNYLGKIELDRMYINPDDEPFLLCIELLDGDEPGGDFFFLHRTTYDGKIVMSWFFAGNGNCIFDILGSDDFQYTPEEIMFEKVSGEMSQLEPYIDTEFYGVFWGKGINGNSLWIDDVHWTGEAYDIVIDYPRRMALYENDVPESILYSIAPDRISDILGDDLFPGEVYVVQTDKDGNIIELISPEYNEYLEGGFDENSWDDNYDVDDETIELILDIVEDDVKEIQEHLNMGMSIMIDGETVLLDGENCHYVILGTDHDEHFVKEIFYAVNILTREVYYYDVLTDLWELI
ncbi:MAG TPA: hypothetical protein VFD00_03595 [Thermoclostridium sp.]|nr:hypothetical protein [Thermoclostridium sp.]